MRKVFLKAGSRSIRAKDMNDSKESPEERGGRETRRSLRGVIRVNDSQRNIYELVHLKGAGRAAVFADRSGPAGFPVAEMTQAIPARLRVLRNTPLHRNFAVGDTVPFPDITGVGIPVVTRGFPAGTVPVLDFQKRALNAQIVFRVTAPEYSLRGLTARIRSRGI